MRKKVDFAYTSTASRSTFSEYLHSHAFRIMRHTPLCAGATSRNGSKAHQRPCNEAHMQCTYYVFSDQCCCNESGMPGRWRVTFLQSPGSWERSPRSGSPE